MKGREAIEILAGIPWCENRNAYLEIERILKEGGWLPPETIAKEYIRLDAVVEGEFIYTPSCCKERGDDKYFNCKEPGKECVGCFYYYLNRRPATVADLIGGKKG